jgi:hypothetical protein
MLDKAKNSLEFPCPVRDYIWLTPGSPNFPCRRYGLCTKYDEHQNGIKSGIKVKDEE